MNKQKLIDTLAEKTGMTKKGASQALDTVLNSVVDALKKGEKVTITGFGTFEVRSRKSRTGRNPQTGAEITIPARKVAAFRAGKALKDAVK
jgi:DNA-binding protein HU-beta